MQISNHNSEIQSMPLHESRQQFDRAFTYFPKEEMFRLYIDYNHQHLGQNAFDKERPGHGGEPGYKAAMTAGFEYVRETLGKKVDAIYLRTLHEICTHKVSAYRFYVPGNYGPGHVDIASGFKPENHYGFDFGNCTDEAKQELESEKLIDLSGKVNSLYLSRLEGKRVHSNFTTSTSQHEMLAKLQSICDRYYKEVGTSNNVLLSIGTFCRSLEIYHVFEDGNQRTIAFALLNKLLIENGFSPCILNDPYVFDGYHSAKELVQDIKNGFENFKKFEKKPIEG
jgi:hypothetical protein